MTRREGRRNKLSRVRATERIFSFSSIFFYRVKPRIPSWRRPLGGTRALEVGLPGLALHAVIPSIPFRLPLSLYHYTSAFAICAISVCRFARVCVRAYNTRVSVCTRTYKAYATCVSWCICDYVSKRGQVWNKMFLCPTLNGRLKTRGCVVSSASVHLSLCVRLLYVYVCVTIKASVFHTDIRYLMSRNRSPLVCV